MKVRILAESDMAQNKEWWGDYWAKVEVEKALRNLGIEVVNDCADIDLYFHASSESKRIKTRIKMVWVYTRLETALKQINYFKQFNHVFCLSKLGVEEFKKYGLSSSFLPAATSMQPFSENREKEIDILFVGNAYKKNRPPLIKKIIDSGWDVHIYGTGWNRIKDTAIQKSWKGAYWPNPKMPELYSKAKIVLTIHEPEMLKSQSLSIRTLDILASKAFCLCDNNEVLTYCPSAQIYNTDEEMLNKIEYFMINEECRKNIVENTHKEAREFTYLKIAEIIKRKMEEFE